MLTQMVERKHKIPDVTQNGPYARSSTNRGTFGLRCVQIRVRPKEGLYRMELDFYTLCVLYLAYSFLG